jgi:hypothetical protein
MLVIRTNTTYRSSAIVFYYTLQHVSAVQISHHQAYVKSTKKNKGEKASLYSVMNYKLIIQ